MNDQESLEAVIAKRVSWPSLHWGDFGHRDAHAAIATAILESDWLAEHDREVLQRYVDRTYGPLVNGRWMGAEEIALREASGEWPKLALSDECPPWRCVVSDREALIKIVADVRRDGLPPSALDYHIADAILASEWFGAKEAVAQVRLDRLMQLLGYDPEQEPSHAEQGGE